MDTFVWTGDPGQRVILAWCWQVRTAEYAAAAIL
jgi:hypothetical protein